MIELPMKKVKASRVNPKSMVIYAQPKMGKTTVLSALENCLIIDLEQGSEFVDAMKYDVIGEAKRTNSKPIEVLKALINEIKKKNNEKGSYVYKYIAVDTVTALEDIVLPLANMMYTKTPMGRNWVGDDVTSLPNGAGYRFTRMALSMVLGELENLCETLIIAGHVKDKLIEKEGKEMNERGLDLTGKSSSILCSQVDAIGYLYRDQDETIINFAPSESLICGARSEHLKSREIVVGKLNKETNKVDVDWSQIFINN
jgi:hypothetical protein